MNAPFSIGQKVVALVSFDHPVAPLVKGNIYTCLCCVQCPVCKKWSVGFKKVDDTAYWSYWTCCGHRNSACGYFLADANKFAPVETAYTDATAEILEKFKSVEETPDKILIPKTEPA